MPPLSASPEPACYRNPGSPADQALTTIVTALADDGYTFSIPSWDGNAYLRISNAVQALTDLTIISSGAVVWEYRSFRYPHSSPRRLIGTVIELLDPDHTRSAPAVSPEHFKLTVLGSIGRALADYGLAVAIAPTGTDTCPLPSGRHADYSPGSADLDRLTELMDVLSAIKTPDNSGPFKKAEHRWRSFVDDPESAPLSPAPCSPTPTGHRTTC